MSKLIAMTLFLMTMLGGCAPSTSGTSGTEQTGTEAQIESVTDLSDLLASGKVTLLRANGNGSSSGNSVEAVFLNNTDRPLEVDIFMRQPLYLANSGVGQNMVASMVVGADGGYSQLGERSFITLKPNEQLAASLIAYCADFDKENPQKSENFSVAATPQRLVTVMARINQHVRANPSGDSTSAAQVAVWLAQGESIETISKKFQFTPADEQLARSFLQ